MRRRLNLIIESFGAVPAMVRLGAQIRFRLRGRYWQWRRETAFGGGEPAPRDKRRMIFHYARWVWRMGRYM